MWPLVLLVCWCRGLTRHTAVEEGEGGHDDEEDRGVIRQERKACVCV